jgi:hypothetical protein
MSSNINYWLGSFQSTYINLWRCVYQSESGFNLDCILVSFVMMTLKWEPHIFDSWWWPWPSLAVMRCLLTFHFSGIFYCESLWLLSHGMWDHIYTSQLSTWRSKLSHVDNFSCVFCLVMWGFSKQIKPYQCCAYRGLFHCCFAEILTKHYISFHRENGHNWL